MMMKSNPNTPSEIATAARRHNRRGVAMLLVILAMGIGSILAMSFLASRNNSVSIGQNVASATASSWSANAAADIGVGILQTSLDWRTKAATGVLMNTQRIAGGDAIVRLTNLSGLPPTATDREVIMTATSTVNGVPSTVQRIVEVPPPPPVGVVDLGLNEFTIFASEGLAFGSNGVVAVWSASPEALSIQPVKIGVGFTPVADMIVNPSAVILRSELYIPNGASLGLQSYLNSGLFIGGAMLPLSVPALSWIVPSRFDALPPINTDITISKKTITLAPGAYRNVKINKKSVVTIDGALGSDYSFIDLKIEDESVVVIKGDVNLWIKDDLRINKKSALELGTSTARLTVFVYDDMIVDDSSVGFPRAVGFDPTRSRNDPHTYIDPRRITIRGLYRPVSGIGGITNFILLPAGSNTGGPDIQLEEGSLVVASFQTPGAVAQISGGSTLYGRITARLIDIQSTGAVLGDPTLDNHAGFTTLSSSLYDANGNVASSLSTALAAIDPPLGVVTNQTNLEIQLASAIVVPTAPAPPANGGTPRIASRAVARDWPVRAMALEANAAPTLTQFTGSYLTTKTISTTTLDIFGVPQFTITSVSGSNGAIP